MSLDINHNKPTRSSSFTIYRGLPLSSSLPYARHLPSTPDVQMCTEYSQGLMYHRPESGHAGIYVLISQGALLRMSDCRLVHAGGAGYEGWAIVDDNGGGYAGRADGTCGRRSLSGSADIE